MTEYRSADELWCEVMKSQLENHPQEASKKWKAVSRDANECVLCDDPGGGALIRCNNERCNKFFHLDCAFHHGGLSLSDSGLLTYECDAHFKHVVFCKCRQKYENTKPMVYCDECFDWYHESCEKLNPDELVDMDQYVCLSCQAAARQGKTIPQATKDRNLEKEAKSTCNQNAIKAVGMLVEIAAQVCPVMDSLYGHSADPAEISDVFDIVAYLSTPTFQPRSALAFLTEEQKSSENDDSALVQALGVLPLLQLWKQHAQNYLDRWKAWLASVVQASEFFVHENGAEISLDERQIPVIQVFLQNLEELEKERTSVTNSSQKDLEAYNAFIDCVKWLGDFLQELHRQPKTVQWAYHINSTLRNVNAKSKRLNGFSKDVICSTLTSFFHNFVRKASEAATKMTNWITKANKIILRSEDHKLEDLEKFAASVDEFPSRPYLCEEIADLIAKGQSLELSLQEILNTAALKEDQLEAIDEQKTELGVVLPSENVFENVKQAALCIKAFQLSSAEGRIPEATASSLLNELCSVLHALFSVPPPTPALCLGLASQVQSAKNSLEYALSGAQAEINAFNEVFSNELSFEQVTSVLANFQRLAVIMPQEEVLVFVRDSMELAYKADLVLSHRAQCSINDLEALIDTISVAISNAVIDQFPEVKERKSALTRSFNALVTLQTEAEKHWTLVNSAINDLRQGLAITHEVLQELFQGAAQTGVANAPIEQSAVEMLTLGKVKEDECLQRLQHVTNASAGCLSEAQALLTIVHHHAIPLATANRVRLLHETCEAVAHCSQFLSDSSQDGNVDLLRLRDCSRMIHKLDGQVSSGTVEHSMLYTVRDRFMSFAWTAEVQSILKGKNMVALVAAERLIAKGAEMGLGIVNTQEWSQLQSAISTARDMMTASDRAIVSVNAILESITIDEKDVGDLGSMSLRDVMQSSNYLALKAGAKSLLDLARPLVEELSALNGRCSSLLVAKEEESTKVGGALATVTTYANASAFVLGLESLQTLHGFLLPDLADLVSLETKLLALTDVQQGSVLLNKMALIVKAAHAEVNLWMERTLALLPMRTSRHRNRFESRGTTVGDLQLLSEDLAVKICHTAVHQRIEEVNQEVVTFRSKLIAFLLKPQVGELSNSFAHLRSGLFDDIKVLTELQSDADLIPLDLPEFWALRWVFDLFVWLEGVPFPGEDPNQFSMTLEAGQKKLIMGVPLIRALSAHIVQELSRLGVMRLDENKVPVGFHPKVHGTLARSGEIYDHLEEQVKLCREFQRRVETAIRADHGPGDLSKLVAEMRALLIEPDAAVRRMLEKTLAAKGHPTSGAGGVPVALGRQRKRQSDDAFFYDDDVTAGSGLQLPRAVIVKEAKPPKPIKKAKQFQCAAQNCGKELRSVQWSGFCSDACAIRSASEMFAAMMSYKECLPALSTKADSANVEAFRSDLNAFDLVDGKGNALTGATPVNTNAMEIDAQPSPRGKVSAINSTLAKVPAVMQVLLAKDMLGAFPKALKIPPKVSATPNADHVLRTKARASWEDFFVQSLQRMEIKGDMFLAIVLSEELEAATYQKYSTGGQFDVKEYKKHHQMLLSNLRQAHNESLIRKLSNGELAMDQLIAMSVQQLADTNLQQLRQKQFSNVVGDAHRKSTEEEQEEQRRAVMAGNESWRDRTGDRTASSTRLDSSKDSITPEMESHTSIEVSVDTSQNLEPMDVERTTVTEGDPASPGSHRPVDGSSISSMDGATARSVEIEERISGGTKPAPATVQSKRSLDVDAVTRFTTNAPRPKAPRIDTSDEALEVSKPAPPSVESPRKAPSLLEILKASKTNSMDADDEEYEPEVRAAHKKSSGSKHPPTPTGAGAASGYVPTMRLINNEGGTDFVITRPGGIVINASAMVNDKRVQGSVKPTFNIDGRTRIKELDRFAQDVIASGRKIVAVCVFLVFHDGSADSSYNKFCDEFTRDSRAGISNVSDGVQAYVIPPGLKDSVSILQGVKFHSHLPNTGVLFGVIITKESGSSSNASHSTLPFATTSFAVPSQDKLRSIEQAPPVLAVPIAPAPVSAPIVAAAVTPFIAAGAPPQMSAHRPPTVAVAPATAMAAAFPRPGVFPGSGPPVAQITQQMGRAPPMPHMQTPHMPLQGMQGGAIVGHGGAFATLSQPVLTQVDKDKILQVAQFCATKGVAKLQSLKDNPTSPTVMPFLYEGNPGYEVFMQALRECVGLANKP